MKPEKLYDNIHELYDKRHVLAPSTRWLKKHEDPIIRSLRGRTLDIGCGTGYDLRLLKDAVGLDPSEKMLEIARSAGKEFVVGRAEKLPFPDCSFDNAICLFGTLNMCDRKKAAAEMSRVLKPSGTVVISVASVWDRGYGIMKRLKIEHPAKDKALAIDGNKMRITLFEKKELVDVFWKNGMKLTKFISLFKFQNPKWGNWDKLSLLERLRLHLDAVPILGDYGAMYIMVFKKSNAI
jgi:ubiquinone/menaquinone biosynthesis C-methylase UbiE